MPTIDEVLAQYRAEKAAAVETNRKMAVDRANEIAAEQAEHDRKRKAAARAKLEADVKREFLDDPLNTEADWERRKLELMDAAKDRIGSPFDQARRRLQSSGQYGAF